MRCRLEINPGSSVIFGGEPRNPTDQAPERPGRPHSCGAVRPPNARVVWAQDHDKKRWVIAHQIIARLGTVRKGPLTQGPRHVTPAGASALNSYCPVFS